MFIPAMFLGSQCSLGIIRMSARSSRNAHTKSFSNYPRKGKYKKVLVVSKLSNFESERVINRNLNDDQFESKLRNRGTDYDRLKHYHHVHKDFEEKVLGCLISKGMEFKLATRMNYTKDKIDWADIVMSTGGDGTFLLAASMIRNNRKPVVGFNSVPERSEGYLCLPKMFSDDIVGAMERLQEGNFNWLLRSRIRTTVFHRDNLNLKHMHPISSSDLDIPWNEGAISDLENGKVLPFLALNEVFIGECLSARVSHLEMLLNGEQDPYNVKCSGLCVSTGTGSTSWHWSINQLSESTMAEILVQLRMLVETKLNESDTEKLPKRLAKMYNDSLTFEPDDARLGYTIRDLISVGVWPQPKGIQSRGFVSKLRVKSKCVDACLVVDGGVSFEFNDGCAALLEIHENDALRTIQLC